VALIGKYWEKAEKKKEKKTVTATENILPFISQRC
jgi:hypothetical protein